MSKKEPSITRRQALYRSLAGVFLYISVASQRAEACFVDQSAVNPILCDGLDPQFETPSSTADGFTVQVSNYDANFTWSVNTTAGSVTISGEGLVTVTGLAPGESATVTAVTTRTGYNSSTASASASSVAVPPTPVPMLPIWGVAALSGMLTVLAKQLKKK